MKKNLLFIICMLVSITTFSQVNVTATQGTTSGSYTTLKNAFDKINDGTHQGMISIALGDANDQTITETSQATINRTGEGSTSYSKITIYPAYSNITISGALNGSAPTLQGIICINKAENIVFDGRINLTVQGENLTIENTSSGNWSTAIYFSGASKDTIRFCNIKSSTTGTSSGIGTLSFWLNDTLGCQENTIEYCNITKSGSNLPNTAIASSNASNAYRSLNNIIRYCNISEFKRNGIWIGNSGITDYNTLWIIDNNTLFETSAITISPTNYSNWAICIGYHDASNTYRSSNGIYTITNNIIGGNGSGGDWTVNSSSGSYTVVGGIFLYGTNTDYSVISGNEIKDFSVQTYCTDQLYYKLYGFNGIFTYLTKVKVGSSSGNTIHDISITHSGSSWGGVISGIYVSNSSDLSCEIKYNHIYNINAESGTANFQYLYGIYSYAGSSVATDLINKNVIKGINASKVSYIYGVYGLGEISQNHVSNIKMNGGYELCGIKWLGAPPAGISTYRVENNEIVLGLDNAGNNTAADQTVYGIYFSSNGYAYYNSILIQGISLTGSTHCFRLNSATTGYVFRNNLLYNDRTSGSGKHFCISTGFTNPAFWSSSNNAFVVSDGAGNHFLGNMVGSDMTDLAAWGTTSGETNSISETSTYKPTATFFPILADSTQLSVDDSWLCNGISVETTTDILGHPRSLTDPNTIGAYEMGCSTTGLTESEEKELYIFPNPANDIVNISWNAVENSIVIYNSMGMIVLKASNKNIIDISELCSGAYLLEWKAVNGLRKTVKFIKE